MFETIEPLAFRSTIMVVMMKISRLLCIAALAAFGTTASAATLSGVYVLTGPDSFGDQSFDGSASLSNAAYSFTGLLELDPDPAAPFTITYGDIDVTPAGFTDSFLLGEYLSHIQFGINGQGLEMTFKRTGGNALDFARGFTVRLSDYFSGNCDVADADDFDCAIEVSEAAVIPLPAAMPMLLLGLGAIGVAARRRRAG